MTHDRRHLDSNARELIVRPDDHGSECPVVCGPKRFVLRINGRNWWISKDSNRMQDASLLTDDPAKALQFGTALEALMYQRHTHPATFDRPLALLSLQIEEAKCARG